VLWNGELRLRNRNGGTAGKLSVEEVNAALTRGMGFFQVLREYNAASMQSFNPAKEIVGRLSANFPMPWTVYCDPEKGIFQISGSSPVPVTTPAYDRQVNINSRLGGKVLATYSTSSSDAAQGIVDHIGRAGFEPNTVVMDTRQLAGLADDVEKLGLWDDRQPGARQGHVLLASPWGFRWLTAPSEFYAVLEQPLFDFDMATTDADT
jgi:hypothetical protein